jgi:23S rRNA (pseudouridine1915-N3)-methyltransferase
MRMTLLAVTGKQPRWLDDAVEEYAKRLRPLLRVDFVDLKAASRSQGRPTEAILLAEHKLISAQIPAGAHVIALDERGASRTTERLSRDIAGWRQSGEHLVFVIGGPDGLASDFKASARETWALSQLTLPHGLAKLILVEQLYRAASLLEGHPYHRA